LLQLRLDATYSRLRGRIIDHETGRPVAAASIDLTPKYKGYRAQRVKAAVEAIYAELKP